MPSVSVVKCSKPTTDASVHQAVRGAVSLLGGMSRFVKPSERVLIKPNLVRPSPPPTTTDPRVIHAVAEMVAEAGAKPVIGEGTATMTLLWREGMDSRRVMELTGVEKVAKEVGAELAPFDEKGAAQTVEVDIPDGVVLRRAAIAKAALECDAIIPVPVMKCSMEGGGVTLCVKCLHALTDPYTDRLKFHRSDLWQKLVDIVKLVRPKIRLSVIDGILAMEGDGPIYGDTVEMDTIIAGDDPVSTDAIGSMVMGFHDPFEVGTTAIAHAQGVGVADPNQIRVLGDGVEEVRRPLRRASCEILANIFPNVMVIEGGACRTCKAWMKFLSYALKGHGILEKTVPRTVGQILFICGLEPSLPDDPRDLLKKGLPIVFGDCAIFSTKQKIFWQLRDQALYIPGCPPFAVGPNTRMIETRLGVPITGKEAYGFRPTYGV